MGFFCGLVFLYLFSGFGFPNALQNLETQSFSDSGGGPICQDLLFHHLISDMASDDFRYSVHESVWGGSYVSAFQCSYSPVH